MSTAVFSQFQAHLFIVAGGHNRYLTQPRPTPRKLSMRTIAEVEANVALVCDPSGRIDLDDLHQHYV